MATLIVASFVKHFDEIPLIILNKKLDVLGINETRLDSAISDEIAGIDGYNVLEMRWCV